MRATKVLLSIPEIQEYLNLCFEAFKITKPKDQARYKYVIDYLLHQRENYPERYELSGVPMNRNKLAIEIGVPNSHATVIIRNLLRWQVIEKISLYSRGKSRTFRIATRFENCKIGFVQMSIDHASFIKKQVRRQYNELVADSVLYEQHRILDEEVSINEDGLTYLANKYANEEMNDLLYWYRTVRNGDADYELDVSIAVESKDMGLIGILVGNLFAERPDRKSRVYTNLTSLKREHRKFIDLDEKPLLMTDIINSQVVFSVAAIKQYLSNFQPNKKAIQSLKNYQDLAISGSFYEALAEEAGYELSDQNRSIFKKEFFRQIFFSRVRSKGGDIKKAFRRKFLPIAVAISKMKQGNHANFAVALQRMEAQVMIDEVLKTLIEENIVALSIHDSIVVSNPDDRRRAEHLIKQYMSHRFGFAPKMKRE